MKIGINFEKIVENRQKFGKILMKMVKSVNNWSRIKKKCGKIVGNRLEIGEKNRRKPSKIG